jgi:RimJ/RimL family protein N-acetyltransferase
LKILPLEQEIELGLELVNDRPLQVGHILPLTEKLFTEYFPAANSFLILRGRRPEALFSFRSGRQKASPMASFGIAATSKSGFKAAIMKIEQTAVAQEKTVLRTRVFGYDNQKLQALRNLGYQIGASLHETVSLSGRRYDWHLAYKELAARYSFQIERAYAKPGLYPTLEVEKVKNARLRVRGYRAEDRPALDMFATHPNVMRGIGSAIFEGLYPWVPGVYQEMVNAGRVFPLVCEDEASGQVVGTLDLFKQPQDVMQHTMGVGMFVKPDYQGVGVGTLLMEHMKTLAKRLNLANIWLSVFDGNTPAERLYRKAGFVDCGKLPGWLQEGYVNETYMTLELD